MTDRDPARIVPVILSGGSGARLWPVSRALYPKQLLPLVTRRRMLQETAVRAGEVTGHAAPVVVCNSEHRFAVAEQLREVGIAPDAIVLEPVARGTAPAAALGALLAAREAPDTQVLLLPSDHVIARPQELRAAVGAAGTAAAAGYLVTFGIPPRAPETAYGYLRAGAVLDDDAGVRRVERFIEKPGRDAARRCLAAGGYLWNSGMFLFRADAFLAELERLEPAIPGHCRDALDGATPDLDFLRPHAEAYAAVRAVSIDHAVMERTDRAAVVPVDPGWRDIGSWAALWELAAKDRHGNASRGDTLLVDTRNTLVRADSRLVATVGLDDMVVVETADAVLVADKANGERIRGVVEALKARGRGEADTHARVQRPWGAYHELDRGTGFRVKRIVVDPGGRLSLQRHAHRAEHWVVVRGTARVTPGPGPEALEVSELPAGRSIDVPVGWVHRLECVGAEPCVVIEVQSGDHLSEDDIERLQDSYGRS